MVKRTKVFISAVFMSMTLCVVSAHAEEGQAGLLANTEISVSGSLDVFSKYVWRGFLLDDDPVIQPGVSVSAYGLTISFWSSFDIEDDNLDSDELDYVIDYTYETDDFTVSVGHTYYDFPAADANSREFYIGGSLPNVPLGPALTVYIDYEDEEDGGGDGTYIALDLGHSFTVPDMENVSLDLGVSIGYNNELFIEGDGINMLLTAGLDMTLAEGLSLKPSIAYSIPYGDLEDETDGAQDSEVYGGVGLAYEF